MIKHFKNSRGFVILFAVTISAILLAISLGVANIAFREIKFSTSAKDTNDAFFAADTGAECALSNDKSSSTSFIQSGGSGVVQCLGGNVNLAGAYPAWSFILTGLSANNQSCSKVTVTKTLISAGGPSPGTITFKNSSTAATAGASSLIITAPAGLANNDVMIAVINVNIETTTITPPSGWTLIRSINTTLTANGSVYYKRASSESGNYTFNFSSSQRATGAIAVFSGVIASGSPIDVENGQANPSSVSATAPSITTTGDNEMLIFASVNDNGPVATWTPPSGMTEAADSNSAASVTIDYSLKPTAGATGTVVGACTDAGTNASFLFALKPGTISGTDSYATSIVSKGYNNGSGSGACTPTINTVERELDVDY